MGRQITLKLDFDDALTIVGVLQLFVTTRHDDEHLHAAVGSFTTSVALAERAVTLDPPTD